MPQWCDKHKRHTIDEDCPDCERKLLPPFWEFTDQELTRSILSHEGYTWFLRAFTSLTKQVGSDRSYILMKKTDFDKLVANQKE